MLAPRPTPQPGGPSTAPAPRILPPPEARRPGSALQRQDRLTLELAAAADDMLPESDLPPGRPRAAAVSEPALPPRWPELHAMIWDVDGTLAETEFDGHRIAFNRAFAEAGLGWHWDVPTYARLLATTGGKERMLAWWQSIDPAGAAGPAAGKLIAALHVRKTALYTERVANGGIALRPGVRRLLLEARAARVRLAIATTTTAANVRALLKATMGTLADSLFEVIVTGEDVQRKKPDPEAYRLAVARLGVPAERCLALEDSAPGVEAALAAGLATVALRSQLSRDEAWPEAWHSALLADLDGLGSHAEPAAGQALGTGWRGLVDGEVLAGWMAERQRRRRAA